MTDERAASLRLAIPHLVNKIREGVSRRFTVYGFVWKKPSEDAGTKLLLRCEDEVLAPKQELSDRCVRSRAGACFWSINP